MVKNKTKQKTGSLFYSVFNLILNLEAELQYPSSYAQLAWQLTSLDYNPRSRITFCLRLGYIQRIHMHAHCTAECISVMSLLLLCFLMYSIKLKSPLDPESTWLSASRAITQPWSDASLAASVCFVAQQRGLIWEYWCTQGSLWPCCKQAAWMSLRACLWLRVEMESQPATD